MPPTLSQLETWDTDHLIDAATYWTKTADQWDDAFTQMRNQSHAMGWEGVGGDALRTQTTGDLATVSAKADQLRKAAQIARTGASNISAAQRQTLYAIDDAQNAGFQVGEDLSVTDTRTSRNAAEAAARQAQAQTFAASINARAAQLLGVETETSGQLTAAAGDVGTMNFAGGHSGVQLMDFNPNPGSPPPPFAPWDTPDGKPQPGAGLSAAQQQMILGGNPANMNGQGLMDNLRQLIQSLPENDPRTAWLRGQVADLQAHVNDIDYARTHCSTDDWIQRTSQFASGVIVTGGGLLTAETGAGLVIAGAGGLNTVIAGGSLLKCLTGSK